MNKIIIFLGAVALMLSWAIAAEEDPKAVAAQPEGGAVTDHQVVSPANVKWGDGPAGLPPGAKLAVLSGNPKEPGLFTIRLQFPAGYKVMPHTHPAPENVTVISGKMNLGMGTKFDQSATKALSAGDFSIMPKGMAHFGWTGEVTVVQIHSTGPFEINYINPADDPRGAKK